VFICKKNFDLLTALRLRMNSSLEKKTLFDYIFNCGKKKREDATIK